MAPGIERGRIQVGLVGELQGTGCYTANGLEWWHRHLAGALGVLPVTPHLNILCHKGSLPQ